jgi:hypothetical protein
MGILEELISGALEAVGIAGIRRQISTWSRIIGDRLMKDLPANHHLQRVLRRAMLQVIRVKAYRLNQQLQSSSPPELFAPVHTLNAHGSSWAILAPLRTARIIQAQGNRPRLFKPSLVGQPTQESLDTALRCRVVDPVKGTKILEQLIDWLNSNLKPTYRDDYIPPATRVDNQLHSLLAPTDSSNQQVKVQLQSQILDELNGTSLVIPAEIIEYIRSDEWFRDVCGGSNMNCVATVA